MFETPERLAEDKVTIVHFRSRRPASGFPGRPRSSSVRRRAAPLRGAEIVLAAAGGPPTIDFPEILPLLEAINPRIIVPMHYKTPKINLNIQPLERFVEVLPDYRVERPGTISVEITRSDAAVEQDDCCFGPAAGSETE